MALEKDIYRELEDIVGPKNISDDPAIIDVYSFQRLSFTKGADVDFRYFTKAEAVVLPGCTREVQAIVRLCNRRGIKSKATSTGYGATNTAGSPGVILLDMRRMDRILELDEKNMFVVTEPYVSFAQVQAEAMKRGLGCHIVGAGSQVSWLASHTSVIGNNTMAVSQGHSARNLFGVEWVSPTGEIIRLGAPGSGAGWFSGDGPGPSLRGIMRGAMGASGGLGVFTKCAGHLHPWHGPKEIEVKGTAPAYSAVIPPFSDYHVYEFPSWKQYAEAQYKIGEAGIAYATHKTGGPGSHGGCVTVSNNEYYEKWDELKTLPRISFSIVLLAYNQAEFDYQRKTLDRIIEETGGKIWEVGETALWKDADYLTMMRACFIPRLAFRLSGAFDVDGMLGIDSLDHCSLGLEVDAAHRDKYAEKGIIMDDGTLNSWAVSYEAGHMGLFECGHQYNPTRDESAKGMMEMVREGLGKCFDTPFALGWAFFGAELLGPHCGNYHRWMPKIKKMFDPNNASDPMGYAAPEN